MQHRGFVAAGRPSGTDGSDYSYRMVVDSRYTKVARGKSHLRTLLVVQTALLIIGLSMVVLSASQEKKLKNLAVGSIALGFISVIVGQIGRTRSQAGLLRFHIFLSAMATALSVAFVVRNDVFVKVIKDQYISDITAQNLFEAGWMLLGVLVQIFVVATTVTLLYNMSPKRAARGKNAHSTL